MLASCRETEEPVSATPPERQPAAGSPVQAADPRPAATLLETLVARGHGARRGAFDRISVELRREPDGAATTVLARLPDRLRVTHPDGSSGLLRSDGAWTWTGESNPVLASAEARAELERLRQLLDLLTLGPLERELQQSQPEVARVDRTRLAVGTGEARVEIEHDPATDLIRGLRGAGIAVRVLDRHISERPGPGGSTERTVVPIRIDEDRLGTWHLRFLGAGVDFAEQVFAPPDGSGAETFTLGGPAVARAPRIEAAPAVSWLMIEDPGTWAARMQLVGAIGPRLGPLGYGNGGDPMLVTTEERRFFVVPFRRRRDDARPFVPGPGEQLRSWPVGRIVAVDPVPGESFDRRVAAGRAAVEAFARAQGLSLEGPVCVAVNLIGRDPGEDPRSLDQAPVRVLARIAP